MMTLAELSLIREFVVAALAAGLVRTMEGVTGAAAIGQTLAREIAALEAEARAPAEKQKAEQEKVSLDELVKKYRAEAEKAKTKQDEEYPPWQKYPQVIVCNNAAAPGLPVDAVGGGQTCSGSEYPKVA